MKEKTPEKRSRRKWKERGALLGILALHITAILIFTKGFLLTRTELPFHSHCSHISESPCLSHYNTTTTTSSSSSSSSSSCWTKPAVDRVVIIVLDAIRFDFVAPSGFFPEPKPWMDKLRVLQKYAYENVSSSRIFKAIADPPTTSLQRLKGLTTGGLPTFIDVGNSFGAPAIVEDNFINQLVQSGKRVVMMGDDTWTQLFPHHFHRAYPYPSFNVKDLHTVDNGCIEHLLPSLYEEDWDVLIAHFLGIDHAGHIFGVDSTHMIDKLEQYNTILERVIEVLENQSGPGGLHENTFLLVMGDHGQTMNGDHGGGGAEEVETSIFAMSLKKPSYGVPAEFDTSTCNQYLDGKNTCVSTIQQLDFAATISALLGIPFPYGSIGHVDPQLYALAAGTWNFGGNNTGKCQDQLKLEEWMQNYANVLCVNSWQVKRYIDAYSASSVTGFSTDDLMQISNIYAEGEKQWSHASRNILMNKNESCNTSLSVLKMQIDTYFKFLAGFAELARSKWTEFNLKLMGIGLGIMVISLFIHLYFISQVASTPSRSNPSHNVPPVSIESIYALFIVVIRACSFLSNSYILVEGKVANFLLATASIYKLRYSITKGRKLCEAVISILLISILRFSIEVGLSKQAATSAFLNLSPTWVLGTALGHSFWINVSEVMPSLGLVLLAYLLYRTMSCLSAGGLWRYTIVGSALNYLLIAIHWALECNIMGTALLPEYIGKHFIPRITYAIGFAQLLLLSCGRLFHAKEKLDFQKILVMKTVAILSACSSTVIILSGKQGSLIALAAVVGGYCIVRLQNVEDDKNYVNSRSRSLNFLPVTQWSLLAVCLFFSTGHWCAFDGLRYGAAFIGFDEFILARQAILLAIETFGFSIILPVFGLPLLLVDQCRKGQITQRKHHLHSQLSQLYLMYGLITASTFTVTMICVAIQRRHLMVWGLFAPKFVFDVVGLILSDILICLASLYNFGIIEDDKSDD